MIIEYFWGIWYFLIVAVECVANDSVEVMLGPKSFGSLVKVKEEKLIVRDYDA